MEIQETVKQTACYASLTDHYLMSSHTLNASIMKLGVNFNLLHMWPWISPSSHLPRV